MMRVRFLPLGLIAVLAIAACASDEGGEAVTPESAAAAASDLAASSGTDRATSTGSAREPQTAGATPTTVEEAIEIAKRIEADPDRAAEILAEYGLSEEEFDRMLYDIAADPELRSMYVDAMAR